MTTTLQASSTELWMPQIETAIYDEPSIPELEQLWTKHNGEAEILELKPNIYGACTVPSKIPRAFAAIDLCEVVRHSGGSLLDMRGASIADMATEDDGQTFDYGSTVNEWPQDMAQAYRHYYLDEFMRNQVVEPVPYIDSIATMLRHWRSQGIYVVADTSTLPGCEAATIEFLGQRLPHGFDGILLPRNHDGLGSTTKLEALNDVKRAITDIFRSQESLNVPTVAIDDAVHHALAYAEGDKDITVLMPEYPWNTAAENVSSQVIRIAQIFGTLDTFVAADQFLRSKAERGRV